MANTILAFQNPRNAMIDTINLPASGMEQMAAILDTLAERQPSPLIDAARTVLAEHQALVDAESDELEQDHATA